MDKEKKVDLSSQKLPNGTLLVYALQHVLIMVAGAVVVPMLVAAAANDGSTTAHVDQIFLISCALFVSGISTILQGLGLGNFLGAKIAVVEGTSFAALSAMQAIVRGQGTVGIQTLAGAVICAGLMCFLLSGVWGKLLRFFPHVVTGTVVTIIGLSLYPTAIKWIAGSAAQGMGGAYEGATMVNLAVAGISLLIVLLSNKFFKGMLANLGILFGIVGGTIAAAIFDAARGVVGTPDALLNIQRVKEASIIGAPMPFKYGLPKFDPASIFIICVIMLVIMTEATGNMIAVHNMSNKELDSKNLSRGLRSSGLVTMISGAFNSYPVTPFGQNVGMLALTGVFSRFVTVAAGVMLLVLSFFPKFGALFAAIPQPVLGGVGFVMFGVVAVNGIRTLGQVEFNGNKNSIIVATSLGLSLIPSIIPNFFENPAMPEFVRSLLHSGMAIGCISAIFLNLLFNVWFVPKSQKEAAEKAEK